jgi:PhoPQ-activated pathogenicity-related protein
MSEVQKPIGNITNNMFARMRLLYICAIQIIVMMTLFSGKEPRSRRYRRTAAMRLIVQPYDEDDDDYFLSFSW